MNIIIIAGMIDVTLYLFDPPTNFFSKYLLSVVSVLLVGLGSGIYLVANLGPGPRDGLMTGLTKIMNLPIAFVRACLEISVVLIGLNYLITTYSESIGLINRLNESLLSQSDFNYGREDHFESAINQFINNPFLGDKIFDNYKDYYPHNLFLESFTSPF